MKQLCYLLTITQDTCLLLRRDKIFWPTAIIAALWFGLAAIASEWGIEEFIKILFDIGTAGYHLVGVVVAIFWGTKLVADAKKDGSIEVQLSAPISRTTWILGKCLGLWVSLIMLAVFLLVIWQAVIYLNGFGFMNKEQWLMFGFLTFDWLIAGGLAVLFSTLSSTAIAMFSAVCAWLVGVCSFSVLNALSPETSPNVKLIISKIAQIWDLQRFNLSQFIVVEERMSIFPSSAELQSIAGYGCIVLLILLTLSCLFFRKQDLIG